ncbi:lytic transglycosylase domain-containing protein [Phaeovulum sp.]|uniref:lytic transglycosylase domain-containing protein n=1 Tax=Phaeovulum sp. TaxID=2934796 RepID=UPI00272FF0F9|nr:lytic transglycosylase domain-containing protein [Phaeovulum sp.]MDP1669266.1 lytic transglycosylase domain-containing protein [Phaeovulum sp.]MDZ4119269.1 lytic transglycosylase domain-containing protein [Phaeovulum sp.]
MFARNWYFAALFALTALFTGVPRPSLAEDTEALARAMAAIEAKDWVTALAEGAAAGALSRDIVEWHRLRAGEGRFAEFAAFAARRADWPGMPLLRKAGEAKLAEASAAEVRAWFAPLAPQTGAGALALVAAGGDAGEVVRAWRNLSLTEAEQAAFLAAHGPALADHHGGRMQMLLDRGLIEQARAMLDLVSANTRAVAAARIALQADANGVDALIAAVPPAMAGSAGLARDRAAWRLRKGNPDGAAELMLERSGSAEALGSPELWAAMRARLVRDDLRAGNFSRAYRLASRNRMSTGSAYADLEWLAGYAAMKLGDAPAALGHFKAFEAAVKSPISMGRAGYWQGRAHEAAGNTEAARAAYAMAARYQTSYYGLLAAERAGLPPDPALAGTTPLPDWRNAAFTGSSVFQAAVLLRAAGAGTLAKRFFLHLGESLSDDDLARLARLALDWNDAHLALVIAKAAADRGTELVPAYYPLSGMEKLDLGIPPELLLAITRRESEFNPEVISSAGARGLMQVMPNTGRETAAKIGQPFSLDRLLSDGEYNSRLASAYIAGLRAEFGPALALVASGYNAGPGRPRRWMGERGDPRQASVDVIDWVEMIPFEETRNYVMRVSESVAVYRARLSGVSAPVKLTEMLKGR